MHPTVSPTIRSYDQPTNCIDDETYTSPIVPSYGCELYRAENCNCYTFQPVMTDEQLQDLFTRCPEACDVDCDFQYESPTSTPSRSAATFSPTSVRNPSSNSVPSVRPTKAPIQNSLHPSIINVHDCTDDKHYRSPLFPSKGCELHTQPEFEDCTSFARVLTQTQLQNLLDSCPETCEIACSEPSLLPSSSLSPSSQPSACTDDDDYKSPFSNDFGCAFFASASLRCDEWGEALTEEQTLHLWRSCPVACGLECG